MQMTMAMMMMMMMMMMVTMMTCARACGGGGGGSGRGGLGRIRACLAPAPHLKPELLSHDVLKGGQRKPCCRDEAPPAQRVRRTRRRMVMERKDSSSKRGRRSRGGGGERKLGAHLFSLRRRPPLPLPLRAARTAPSSRTVPRAQTERLKVGGGVHGAVLGGVWPHCGRFIAQHRNHGAHERVLGKPLWGHRRQVSERAKDFSNVVPAIRDVAPPVSARKTVVALAVSKWHCCCCCCHGTHRSAAVSPRPPAPTCHVPTLRSGRADGKAEPPPAGCRYGGAVEEKLGRRQRSMLGLLGGAGAGDAAAAAAAATPAGVAAAATMGTAGVVHAREVRPIRWCLRRTPSQ
jgi:hypothetical protein